MKAKIHLKNISDLVDEQNLDNLSAFEYFKDDINYCLISVSIGYMDCHFAYYTG